MKSNSLDGEFMRLLSGTITSPRVSNEQVYYKATKSLDVDLPDKPVMNHTLNMLKEWALKS